jgi:hypothetical protein
MAGENKLQKYLVAQCKSHDILCRKLRAEGRRGWPDMILIFEGHIVFIELKNPNGKGELSALQELEIKEIKDHGAAAVVVDSFVGVDHVIAKLIE